MGYSRERVKYFKSLIKRILVMNQDASSITIQKTLQTQKEPLHLDKDFILRLTKEIDVERTKNADKILLNTAIMHFLERIRETDKQAWNILTRPDTSDTDKLRAIAELRKNGESAFNIMFDAGVFERKLGEVNWNMADVLKAARELEEKEKEDIKT